MFLADSTIWIDFFRGKETPKVNFLTTALENEEDICICGPILTEVLQGIGNKEQFKKTKNFLNFLVYLPLSKETYILSADIYRAARAKGQIVRKTIDCIIAACAISHNVALLHNDTDFLKLEKYSNLKCLEV